ncbi:MAG: 4-(cytidine 5'-diphospho)-2-C-methyl-D-erythritol kinase [Pseudomonadota bacterium]
MTKGYAGRVAAPAKVNLSLHVGPARADGRHPLDSLVMFAGEAACDWLDFTPADQTGLRVTGASGEATGRVEDNLALRALRALERAAPGLPPHQIVLEKALPVAAGLGGGSADAGAVLRALGPLAGLSEADLFSLAVPLGGDVPACVLARACRMQGDGDRVEPVPGLPSLSALLVNPGLACPTGPVFTAFDGMGSHRWTDPEPLPSRAGQSAQALIAWLDAETRNDLEAPACTLVPAIKDVLAALSSLTGAALVRMSGSGASCFALFETIEAAQAAHDDLVRIRPDWWARPVLLR